MESRTIRAFLGDYDIFYLTLVVVPKWTMEIFECCKLSQYCNSNVLQNCVGRRIRQLFAELVKQSQHLLHKLNGGAIVIMLY